MDLTEVRIRNYRTVGAEQHLGIPGRMTIVGPNNTGKTNLLRGLQVLFTGYENSFAYDRDTDLTFGVGKARTSITGTFDGDPVGSESDAAIYEALDELHSLQGTSRSDTEFTLTVYFTDTNTPVYNFFPNIKRPKGGNPAAQYSRIHKQLVVNLLNQFRLHYVPSAKSVNEIYDDLLLPFLKQKVAKVISPHVDAINDALAEAASALNAELEGAGLSELNASFNAPSEAIHEFMSGFEFMLADPEETPIQSKGMGVQTTALLSAFRWISAQEREQGRTVIWLLEEPESYLHPSLATNCNAILDRLADDSIVVRTTHSMAFVPQNPNHVCGTTLTAAGRTELVEFKTFNEAVSAIRDALGIKFGDFYNLAEYNVFLEGPSDREILEFILAKIPSSKHEWSFLRSARLEDFGGVKHLSGFLRATFQFIRQERPCVALFDGDEAGDRERRQLQQYLGQRDITFQANRDFVSVRAGFPIEAIFPDNWIIEIYEAHPSWFDSFSIDASGTLEPFQVKDGRKSNLQAALIGRASEESNLKWATRAIDVCGALDTALSRTAESATQNPGNGK